MAHTAVHRPVIDIHIEMSANPIEASPLKWLFDYAQTGIRALKSAAQHTHAEPQRIAALSRVRGTGPGVSFGRLVGQIEQEHPVTLQSPFEGTESVAGAIWRPELFGERDRDDALMKLRFAQGALDLPLHTHEHSARFIIVNSGRGFFHVTSESIGAFTGRSVRSVPIRSRDIVMFTPGIVHTFSAPDEPLVLLSYHSPFIPLDDERQYRLPETVIRPRDLSHDESPSIACDPAWSILASA